MTSSFSPARASSFPPRFHTPIKAGPYKSILATSSATPSYKREDVDDAGNSGEDEDEEMLDNDVYFLDLKPSEPSYTAFQEPEDPSTVQLSRKRARVSVVDSIATTDASIKASELSEPMPEPMPEPTSSVKSGPARFLIPPSRTPSTAFRRPEGSSTSSTLSRPAFLKPSLPKPEVSSASEPLPEAFSPHRRGQRYIPGGMAGELSKWVIEIGQAASLSSRDPGQFQGNQFVRTVNIQSISGASRGLDGGPIFVEGVDGNRLSIKGMLIQGGMNTKVQLQPGDTIGIKTPTWDILTDLNETWAVCVDWRIINK
ncbi:hypothetical protein AAFC00_000807 [Neodothiora populina]|uniref:Uncharacterized protein n=1 Tax=Neodothiora populina TaxID=2781224 RepID=A0ABR3PM32_9PEZI